MSTSAADLFDQLAEEFIERFRAGQNPDPQEYADGHPDLAEDILDLFPALVVMEVAAESEESRSENPNNVWASGSTPEQLGDFRVIREIGRGGMGVVYEAEQESLGRHVALKVLTGSALASQNQQRRFQREARAAAKLHHTNIVPVFGVGQADGHHFYIMQYIPGLALDGVLVEVRRQQKLQNNGQGGNSERAPVSTVVRSMFIDEGRSASFFLSDLEAMPDSSEKTDVACSAPPNAKDLSDERSLTPEGSFDVSQSIGLPGSGEHSLSQNSETDDNYWTSIARIGVQVSEALAYAHSQGIIHRDIKPANLLLDHSGTVWVTDFGLASLEDHQNLTRTGDILGTLRYMPPEAFSGITNEHGDLYGLGLTLYELLALRPAIRTSDRNQTLKLAIDAKHIPLKQINDDIPTDLQTIVHKAIQREPEQRYASAEEFSDDLKRFLNDEPILARRTSASERLIRWLRRNPMLGGLTATCAVLLVSLVGVLSYAWITTRSALDEVSQHQTVLAGKTQQAEALASEADRERTRAEDATRKALALGERAQRHAEKEVDARSTAERNLYVAQVTLANSELQENNVSTARESLDQSPFHLRGWEWHYLHRLVEHASQFNDRLEGLSDDTRIETSPDGIYIAVVGSDITTKDGREYRVGRVRILDAKTFEEISSIEDVEANNPRVCFFSSGDRIAVPGWRKMPDRKIVLQTYSQPTPWSSRLKGIADQLRMARRMLFMSSLVTNVDRLFSGPLDFAASSLRREQIVHTTQPHQAAALRIHDVRTGELLKTVAEFDGHISAIAVTPDGSRIATLETHETPTAANGRLQNETHLTLYDLKNKSKIVGSQTLRSIPTSRLNYNDDGSLLVGPTLGTESQEAQDTPAFGSMSIYDGVTGKSVRQLPHTTAWHTEGIRFSPDGQEIAMVNQMGMLTTRDVATGERRLSVYVGETKLWDVDYSSDGKWIAVAQDNNCNSIWNAETGEPHLQFRQGKTPLGVRFLPRTQSLVSISRHGDLRQWDLNEGSLPRSFISYRLSRVVGVTPDNKQLILGYGDDLFLAPIGKPEQAVPIRKSNALARYVGRAVISHNGKRLVRKRSATEEISGALEIISLPDGQLEKEISTKETNFSHVAVDGTGAKIAIQRLPRVIIRRQEGGRSFTSSRWAQKSIVEIIKVADDSRIVIHSEGEGPAEFERSNLKIKFDVTGQRLVIGTTEGRLVVADALSGRIEREIHAHSRLSDFAISPDGHQLAVATFTKPSTIFSISDGAVLRQLAGNPSRITFLEYHPDGKRLASAAMDSNVRLWDPETGQCLLRMRGHRHTIRDAMVFSPDGSHLVTQDVMERVRVWSGLPDPSRHLNDLRQQAAHNSNQREFQTAIELLDRVIAARPNNSALYVERGINRVHAGQWLAARDDYQKAIELGRDDVWTRFRPAYLSFAAGDFEAYHAQREQILASNATTDRRSVAQETLRLNLLTDWPGLATDERLSHLQEFAIGGIKPPIWYVISQARYAYRANRVNEWLDSPAASSINLENESIRLVVAMHRIRNQRNNDTMAALRMAITEVEVSFEDSLAEGTFQKTWHGIVSTNAWLKEARGLLDAE